MVDTQEHAMEKPPKNKGPIGSMPQATEEKHRQQVQVIADGGNAVAPQRDIDVIAKPGG